MRWPLPSATKLIGISVDLESNRARGYKDETAWATIGHLVPAGLRPRIETVGRFFRAVWMIGWLQGRVRSGCRPVLTIDTGGVGYEVHVPDGLYDSCSSAQEDVELHIHSHFKNENFQLYGFATSGEKKIFATLLGVSGIGPRLGLALLSHLGGDALIRAARSEETAPFVAVPGVGAKTAKRLVLELKDRFKDEQWAGVDEIAAGQIGPSVNRDEEDAVSVLVNLGYRASEARKALADSRSQLGEQEISEWLRFALRRLARPGLGGS